MVTGSLARLTLLQLCGRLIYHPILTRYQPILQTDKLLAYISDQILRQPVCLNERFEWLVYRWRISCRQCMCGWLCPAQQPVLYRYAGWVGLGSSTFTHLVQHVQTTWGVCLQPQLQPDNHLYPSLRQLTPYHLTRLQVPTKPATMISWQLKSPPVGAVSCRLSDWLSYVDKPSQSYCVDPSINLHCLLDPPLIPHCKLQPFDTCNAAI